MTDSLRILPLFRSELQLRLLALLLLQPERSWTLPDLTSRLSAPQSSVHRELLRVDATGVLHRDTSRRPHQFRAAVEDPLYEPLAELLSRSVGAEVQLRALLDRRDVHAAAIHGSWPSGNRTPSSDIDVVVVGDADVRELRRLVRPVGAAIGRTIDLTLLRPGEFERLVRDRASFARRLGEETTIPLVGDLSSMARGE